MWVNFLFLMPNKDQLDFAVDADGFSETYEFETSVTTDSEV